MPNQHFLRGTWHCAMCFVDYPRDHKADGVPVPVHSGQQSGVTNNTVSEGPQEINRVMRQGELGGAGYFRVSRKDLEEVPFEQRE